MSISGALSCCKQQGDSYQAMDKNLHSRGCCSKTGLPFLVEEGDTLWGNDDDNKNKSVILTYTDIKHEMKSKTEEFSTKNLTMGPQVVWAEVKRWANEEYGGNWCVSRNIK